MSAQRDFALRPIPAPQMSAEIKLDKTGVNEHGESDLAWADLMRHMANTRTLAVLDSAFAGLITEPARLSIRRDGTFAILPDRYTPLEQTLPPTIRLINAMTQAALSPGVKADLELSNAEMTGG
ncbi:MAG: hypothetical protein KAX55_02665 [Propionivibrio sp.]|nr:hypothetical protein [Propionivibrio sp.]